MCSFLCLLQIFIQLSFETPFVEWNIAHDTFSCDIVGWVTGREFECVKRIPKVRFRGIDLTKTSNFRQIGQLNKN